jgi:hypothetical protein
MRTTIRMNAELARRAKEFASRRQRTFTQFIEDAVADYLARQSKPQSRKKIVLPTVGDPRRRMTKEQYRAMIEQMYDEEAERLARGSGATPGR